MSKVLGLDIGSNSVGWALVDTEQESIIGMGVRIFPEAVNEKNTEREQSKNVERRMKRQLRRQYERRRMRTDAVRGNLFRFGLLPTDTEEFRKVLMLDPYELRAKALTTKLKPYEIGRIVDHINSRRGFQSNRKAASEEETSGAIFDGTKDGTKPGINEMDNALNPMLRRYKDFQANKSTILSKLPPTTDGFRTIGEYLQSLDPHQVRRRSRFTLRDHYRIELELILEYQAKHSPDLLPREVIDKILKKVFHQRPLKSVRHLVGNCRFEPMKKRCHASHPEYQRFRMLQSVNALRVVSATRVQDDDKKLTGGERAALMTAIEQAGKPKHDKNGKLIIPKKLALDKPEALKSALGWPKKLPDAKANLEAIDLPSTIHQLYEVLGKSRVDALSQKELHDIWVILDFAADVDWAAEWAKKHLGLTDEKALQFAKIRMEDGYGSLSLKAVRKILPFLEKPDCMQYHEAVVHAGYKHHDEMLDIEVGNSMPALAPADARNPIVQRSFSEMRRVVNAIVKKWGNPDIIRVEMGREIKLPAFKRAKIAKDNKKNRTQNDADKQLLTQDFGVDDPRRHDVLKYRLWREQGEVCMYTGKRIDYNMLFNGSVDVDHILPYSRTLDDSRENKVVCFREINQKKSDLTPIEAIHHGIIDEISYKERVAALYRNHSITPGKQRKLLMTPEVFAERFSDDETTGFVARQLNDTRHTSRIALKYLKHVCGRVEASTGAHTAMLRRKWGLDGVLPELASRGRAWVAPITEPGRKDRDDHRHHAVDALAIALTSKPIIQKISTLNARTENLNQDLRDDKIKLPDAPIAGLFKLAVDAVDNIIVSHRKSKPGRGALHQETLYGIARGRDGNQARNERQLPLYVVRKPLSPMLSCGDVQNIVDPVIRKLVEERLRSKGVNVDADKYTIPQDAFIQPLWFTLGNGQRRQIKRVRITVPSTSMIQLRKDGVYVEPGGNDHMHIVRTPNEKKPLWEVRKIYDVATSQPMQLDYNIDGDHLKLRIGDLVDVPEKGVYKVQKMTGTGSGQMGMYHHADASGDVKHLLRPTPSSLQGAKLNVTVLGEVL